MPGRALDYERGMTESPKNLLDDVAPCGIDCINCEVHADNLTAQMQERLARSLGLDPEQVPCRGCRAGQGCRLQFSACPTLECVTGRGHDFCYQCEDFPCAMLHPAADRADRLPHNLKVYNLCRIRAVGVQRWLGEEAKATRATYFHGTMRIGQGPASTD